MKKIILSAAIALISVNANASANSLINEDSIKSAQSVISGLQADAIFQAEDLGENNHYIRGFDGNGALILKGENAVFFANYNSANFISSKNEDSNPIQKINLKGNAKVFENLEGLFAKKESAKEKEELIVLFDPKCGYCYKLHSEESSYLESGVSLLYVPYAVLDSEQHGVTTSRQGLEYAYSANTNEEKLKRISEVMEYLRENREVRTLPFQFTSKINSTGIEIVKNARKELIPLAATGTPGLLNKQGAYIGGYVPAKHISEAISSQLK